MFHWLTHLHLCCLRILGYMEYAKQEDIFNVIKAEKTQRQ